MRPLGILALLLLAGCAPDRYAYAPVRTTGAEIAGAPAATYTFSNGELRIATHGLARLEPEGIRDSTLRAIAITVVVWNRSDELWTLDGAEQQMVLGGHADVFATTLQVGRAPVTEIGPWATRRIELFFPLPAGEQHAREIPSFVIAWKLHAGERTFTARTPFERFLVEPPLGSVEDIREPEPQLPGNTPPDRRPPSTMP